MVYILLSILTHGPSLLFIVLIGFEIPQNEVEFLRRRLAEERANVERASKARLEAERRCHAAEKERDVYRILARRWKTRVQASSGVAVDDNQTIEEAAAAMLLGSRESVSLLGLGNMFRRIRARTSASARREESDGAGGDDDDGDVGDGALDPSDRMEEDDDEEDEMSEGSSASEEDGESTDDVDSFSLASSHQVSVVGVIGSGDDPLRPQARTVSLSEEDF
jgi:hypothetical protein